MAIALALLAAFTYGAADFLGGLASRKTPAVAVVLLSQVSGIAVLVVAWFFLPGRFYWSDVGWGLGAGLGGAIAIAALYAALARGQMGVVSPITAVVGASVPVAVGLALGERPALLAVAGVVLAFIAVVLVSANGELRWPSLREPGIGLALVSGLAIGLLYVCLGRGHRDAGLALMATTRATSILLLAAFALARREKVRPAPGSLPTILLAGALDMGANLLYVYAARFGLLSLVAVLTSLYPASTVFLARLVLDERLAPVQWVGVGFAVTGVVLIAL